MDMLQDIYSKDMVVRGIFYRNRRQEDLKAFKGFSTISVITTCIFLLLDFTSGKIRDGRRDLTALTRPYTSCTWPRANALLLKKRGRCRKCRNSIEIVFGKHPVTCAFNSGFLIYFHFSGNIRSGNCTCVFKVMWLHWIILEIILFADGLLHTRNWFLSGAKTGILYDKNTNPKSPLEELERVRFRNILMLFHSGTIARVTVRRSETTHCKGEESSLWLQKLNFRIKHFKIRISWR